MEVASGGFAGEAGSKLNSGAVAEACWESNAEADNTGQGEERGSVRQVGGSTVSHKGEEVKEEDEEDGGVEGLSPLDIDFDVCKRTALNWTWVEVELVENRVTVSREDEGEEVSDGISERPPSGLTSSGLSSVLAVTTAGVVVLLRSKR